MTRDCESGETVTKIDDVLRAKYVCKRCIGTAKSTLVQHHIKIGTLSASKVLGARHGVGCSQACATACSGVCSGATWALRRMEAEMDG